MPIVTIPSISKGQENTITLSKSELASQAKVIADSYFSDQLNWKQVVLTYDSEPGNQFKKVIFDASQITPEGILKLSDTARDEFEIQSLTIFDFDGGYLKLYRGDLNTAEFDIVLNSVFSWDSVPSGWIIGANGALDSDGDLTGVAYESTSYSDYDYSFSFLNSDIAENYAVGMVTSESDLSDIDGLVVEMGVAKIKDNGLSVGDFNYIGGLNTVRIVRASDFITIYLNNSVVYNGSQGPSSKKFVARLAGNALSSVEQNF
jgi:hypothetical protein